MKEDKTVKMINKGKYNELEKLVGGIKERVERIRVNQYELDESKLELNLNLTLIERRISKIEDIFDRF